MRRCDPIQHFERKITPFSFASGGWLHQDELQREARRIDSNFQELCLKRLAACPGAHIIKDIQKVEGGFNRCFILEIDNGTKVVAKIPTSLAGPHSIMASSEVATMQLGNVAAPIHRAILLIKFSQYPRKLAFPSPKSWTGTEYIIMDYIDGVKLGEVWHTMNALQRLKCTDTLSRFATELAGITFSRIWKFELPHLRERPHDLAF